jgi:glyceraldehyde-3-phosphate dehydrogenase (NAD(P))
MAETGKHVHVVGTGTIGEPLIGLLCSFRDELEIQTISFNKKQALTSDRPKIKNLIKRGALLCADKEMTPKFEDLGMQVRFDYADALDRADVVIDCTPAGNSHKESHYKSHEADTLGFAAQGSEFGFGKMYARGINDDALKAGDDKYIHIVSCNTHNMAVIIDAIALHEKDPGNLVEGRFVLIRRANDISQEGKFIPAPQVGKHDDERFGTHHARDAYHLFNTLGYELPLFSSAMKMNSQYMHAMWFSLKLRDKTTLAQVISRLRGNQRIALTEKRSTNTVFSFGRDQGHFGRILSQTVVSLPTLCVRNGHEVIGFTFTPQDGNSLLSSVAIAEWFLSPEDYSRKLQPLGRYFFEEI